MVIMKQVNRSFFAVIISLFIALNAFISTAYATTLFASVSKNKVVKNEVFQLRVVADEKASSDAIDFSVLENNFFLGRPSFGTSMNIINGDSSTRSEWNVLLAANKLGIITIPSFTLNGAKTQPISIQVAADTQEPEQSDLVEMQSHLERKELYPNESTYLNARLIIKADPRRLQNPQIAAPSAQGVELKPAGEANQYQSVLDGIEVTVVDQKFQVTAKESGSFTVSGPAFKGGLVYGSNQTGNTRLIQLDVPAKTFPLTVLPKPETYQGTWLPTSQLTLEQTWRDASSKVTTDSPFHTKVGESLTRELVLTVKGISQEQLPNLAINYPDTIRVYAEKPQFTTLDNGDVKMTIKQVLIPNTIGNIQLPEVNVTWWDTQSKSQKYSKANALTLNVEKGEWLDQSSATPITPQNVQTVTVKDAGYWPYFTAFFALLWVATMIVAWAFRNQSSAPTTNSYSYLNQEDSNEYTQLKKALSQGDGVQISYCLTQWRAVVQLTEEEKITLDNELNALNKTLYTTQESPWDPGNLEKLVTRIQKQQAKRAKNKAQPLAKL
ncbi:BatD family protein [Vibrio aestuarianus]|uniref:BatD family protein n=1 Tax=Vibrio aestuarianus TaxID=28171 RepID=UPI003CE4933B